MSISSNHKCICKLIVIIVMFDLVQCWKIGDTVDDIMTSLADNISDIVTTPVQEVEDTKTVMLLCQSNGKEHFFLFWQLPVDDIIVGPTNTFDNFKYDYEILSGNLTVRRVSNEDEGVYHCVSKGVENDDITARPVRMVVKKDSAEEKGVNYFKGVIIVISLVVIFGVGYFIYRVMKKRQKRGLLLAEISSEDEDSADEVFRAPGTSRQSDDFDFNTIRDDEAVLIEIPKVSIDFEDILHNSQK